MRFDLVGWGVLFLVVLVAGLVLFVVFLIWRDGYLRGWWAARATPPTCAKCGYNLSGLSQCRCPECGTTFALDELWRTAIMTKRVPPDRDRKHRTSPGEGESA